MTDYFKSSVDTYIENWNQSLRKESIRTELLPITNTWLETLLNCSFMNVESGYSPTDTDMSILREIASAIDVHLKTFPDGAFVRLGSRSPKDSWTAREEGMKSLEGKHAVNMFINSERIWDDLNIAKINNYTPYIAVRQWLEIQPWQEFRCFYRKSKLVGISQYNYFKSYMPEIEENIQKILLSIEIKSEKIAKHLPYDGTVIVDYVYSNKTQHRPENDRRYTGELIMLEINPWSILTDPCLFNWHEDAFQKPQFRYLDERGDLINVNVYEFAV